MREGRQPAFRIIDANLNRASEGLRVIEDCARFIMDDNTLCGRLKELRHSLTELRTALPSHLLLGSRDTEGDVGTGVSAPTEGVRADMKKIVAANFGRLCEALRSIEECLKLPSFKGWENAEALRYKVYTLEKEMLLRLTRRGVTDIRLMISVTSITSRGVLDELFCALAGLPGVAILLEAKGLPDSELMALAGEAVAASLRTGIPLIVSDRADIAAASGAIGLHLGADSITPEAARAIIGPACWIGVSSKNHFDIENISVEVDYIIDAKAEADCPLPSFIICAVDATRARELAGKGVKRIAISAAEIGSREPRATVSELLVILAEGQQGNA
ncbi:MAG: thiamine phosphate synthase [Candidatus Brocadiia bacterium]